MDMTEFEMGRWLSIFLDVLNYLSHADLMSHKATAEV